MSKSLGQYRIDLFQEVKHEQCKPQTQRDGDRKLFREAVRTRLESIVIDMLCQPVNTVDYATALQTYVNVYNDLDDSK